MRRVNVRLLITLICNLIWFVQPLFATDLMDVYHHALENDPKFKADYSNFLAKSETLPQAWSFLLPKISLEALINRNNQYLSSNGILINTTYNGNEWRLAANQDIFNYQAWKQVQQAGSSVKAALASFNDSAQDLILRTANMYFEILLAQDTLTFAESKKAANQRQLDQATQRFNVGVDTITSVYEAQAAYDQSTSEVIAAKNNLINKNQQLSKITNHLYDYLSPIRDSKIPLIKPEPNNVDSWVDVGLKQNYLLNAAKYQLQAARDNIKAKSSANWPVFSIKSSVIDSHYDDGPDVITNKSSFANNILIPNERRVSSVSLNMSLPIFQGGLVASQTRQAKYEFQVSGQQLEKTYREVIVGSNIAFNTIIDGITKVKADRQTINAQENSLKSVSAQYDVGMRTMTDVVLAQRNLFRAQKQLAGDQYYFIKAILNLKYQAGTLSVTDLEEINAWLNTKRINSTAPGNINLYSLKSQRLLKNLPQ